MLLNRDRKHFKDQLCHTEHGLGVHIIHKPNIQLSYIVLKAEGVYLGEFFELLLCERSKQQRLELTYETVQDILAPIDTEWNKKVAKVFLCANKSYSEIHRIGLDPKEIPNLFEKVVAHDMLHLIW